VSSAEDHHGALTAFQVEVARLFFSLPESAGYLLAGGAALAAQHLTTRPTRDLDLFTVPTTGDVSRARDAFEAAANRRTWSTQRIQDAGTFCRLIVTGTEKLLVDLALDSPPRRPPTASIVGPTFAPEELAARKLVALFDRAEPRDFLDVYALVRHFSKEELLTWAQDVDPGLDHAVLADMMRAHARLTNRDFAASPHHVSELRAYFTTWADELNT
jgi:predicted nucleotidyltransferase component of viral defense system